MLSTNFSNTYSWSRRCIVCPPSASQKSQMTLKIEKVSDGRKTVIRLSGRLRSVHLDELKAQLVGDWRRNEMDLDGVTLVDVEAVRFLSAREDGGVELLLFFSQVYQDLTIRCLPGFLLVVIFCFNEVSRKRNRVRGIFARQARDNSDRAARVWSRQGGISHELG